MQRHSIYFHSLMIQDRGASLLAVKAEENAIECEKTQKLTQQGDEQTDLTVFPRKQTSERENVKRSYHRSSNTWEALRTFPHTKVAIFVQVIGRLF